MARGQEQGLSAQALRPPRQLEELEGLEKVLPQREIQPQPKLLLSVEPVLK